MAGALYLPLSGDERHVQVGLGADAVVFRARPAAALQPYRLSRPPVLLLGPDGGRAGTAHPPGAPRPRRRTPGRTRPAEPRRGPRRAGPGRDPWRGPPRRRGRSGAGCRTAARPTLLDWEALTALGDRPFHPTGRARVGWDQARYRRYSPAGPQPFGLDWVAVRRDHLACGTFDRVAESLALARADRRSGEIAPAGATGSEPGRPPAGRRRPMCSWRPATGRRWPRRPPPPGSTGPTTPSCRSTPGSTPTCCPSCSPPSGAAACARPVATGLGAFRPTASTRTLVPVGRPRSAATAAVHVKLPVGITTLGALRLLPPRYLANAARAQVLLDDRRRPAPGAGRPPRTPATSRRGGPSRLPEAARGYDDKPGHLGCLLRVWPDGVGLGPGQSLVPLGALGVTTAAGRPRDPALGPRPGPPRRRPGRRPRVTGGGAGGVRRRRPRRQRSGAGLLRPRVHARTPRPERRAGLRRRPGHRDRAARPRHRPPPPALAGRRRPGRPRLRREARHPQQPVGRRPRRAPRLVPDARPRGVPPGDRPGPDERLRRRRETSCGAGWPTSCGPPGPASTSRRRRPR